MIPYDDTEINNSKLKMKEKDKKYFTPEVGVSWEGWGNCFYYKKGTKVTLHIAVNVGTTVRKKILTLPEGYRPGGTIPFWGGGADGQVPDKSFVEIYSSGDVWVKCPSKLALILVEFDVF